MKKGIKGEMINRVMIMMMFVVVMMVMGCNSGGVSEGKVDLARKNSFLESLVKIGEGFQEIFGVFGSAVGDALGFSVVKSGDSRSKVGEHFKKIGDGLTTTKNKLNELKVKISDAKSADGSTIKVVEDAIKGANDVFEQLIAALTNLSGVAGNTPVGDNVTDAAVPANAADVKIVIDNVKEIIAVAEKSDVKLAAGAPGQEVTAGAQTNAPAILGGTASDNAGPKFAEEVSKADPWAMIDKIKNSKTKSGVAAANNDSAGELATGNNNGNNGFNAATNADLVAAIALKAMTRDGKFSSANDDVGAVKAAATNAVNKVLGVINIIIRKTVSSNLDKVREAVKRIKYSDTSGSEASQSDTTQTIATK
ncbi:Variable major protein (plasmid) [Borrelia crocidurae DOU]|uniref:Variable large protein n=1 Tax=Borrelia crocidurae DOU TaxID=1293575 RepID=W5SPP2_9SPIR|nr:variable large family protein [Borrelia crocidurae]AHH07076.1 Variable major protein [Borrelia crocidurae DOU]